jgi:hypothetical protein
MFWPDRGMSPIDQARAHLADPKPSSGLWGALFAAGFCALSATLLAGAMIFGQIS